MSCFFHSLQTIIAELRLPTRYEKTIVKTILNTLSAPLAKITGQLTFAENDEQDYLAEYNIKIYSNMDKSSEKIGMLILDVKGNYFQN